MSGSARVAVARRSVAWLVVLAGALVSCASSSTEVDQNLTEQAVARADRAARIVGRDDVVEPEHLDLEMFVLSKFMVTAADDGRSVDLPAVAQAWIAELDEPGAIADFVISYADDVDVDEVGKVVADRYAVAVSIAAVLSTPARDDLRELFADSISLADFEIWLRSGSTGAILVRASFLTLPD